MTGRPYIGKCVFLCNRSNPPNWETCCSLCNGPRGPHSRGCDRRIQQEEELSKKSAEDDKELCSQLAIAESTYEEEDVNVDDEFNVVASSVVDIQERFNPPCSNLSCDWPSSGKKSTSLKVFVRQQQPLGCNNDGTAADRAWQITFKQRLDHYRPRTPDASLRSSTATTASRTRTSMVQGASRAEVGLEKMMDFPRKKTKMESLSGHDQQHCRVLLWNRRFHDLASQCPLLIANDLSRMD